MYGGGPLVPLDTTGYRGMREIAQSPNCNAFCDMERQVYGQEKNEWEGSKLKSIL